MDGLSIDEIVKGGTFLSPRKPQQEEPTFGTQNKCKLSTILGHKPINYQKIRTTVSKKVRLYSLFSGCIRSV